MYGVCGIVSRPTASIMLQQPSTSNEKFLLGLSLQGESEYISFFGVKRGLLLLLSDRSCRFSPGQSVLKGETSRHSSLQQLTSMSDALAMLVY
jgi:hypothetical protein